MPCIFVSCLSVVLCYRNKQSFEVTLGTLRPIDDCSAESDACAEGSTIQFTGAVEFCALAQANIFGLSDETSYTFNNSEIGCFETGILELKGGELFVLPSQSPRIDVDEDSESVVIFGEAVP